jgi:gas vesicle protein
MSDRKYYSEEAKQTVRTEKALLGLSGLVAGVGIGSAIALLFAPEDGDTMRQRLMDALGDSTDKGKEKLMETLRSIEVEYPDFADRISQAVSSMNTATDDA